MLQKLQVFQQQSNRLNERKLGIRRFMIHPDFRPKLRWNTLIMVLLITTAFIAPVRLAFPDVFESSKTAWAGFNGARAVSAWREHTTRAAKRCFAGKRHFA